MASSPCSCPRYVQQERQPNKTNLFGGFGAFAAHRVMEENKEFLPCNGLVASQQKQQLFRPSYVKSIFFLTWSKFFLHIGTSGRVREVAKEQWHFWKFHFPCSPKGVQKEKISEQQKLTTGTSRFTSSEQQDFATAAKFLLAHWSSRGVTDRQPGMPNFE